MLIFASFYSIFQQSVVCTQGLVNYVLSPMAVVQSIIYYLHFTDGKTEVWSADSK